MTMQAKEPARPGSDNHPTGDNSHLLGMCETQLTLVLEEPQKETDMKTEKIRQATTHDLQQYLEKEYPEPNAISIIRCELKVRNIINASVTDGCDSVAQLESETGFDAYDKIAILSESERRERTGYNRMTLIGKIRATRKRIEKSQESAA